MLAAVPTHNPLPLLLEWLQDDRRAGMPWTPEDFAQRVWLACRETHAPGWLRPIIDTYPAWASAYTGRRAGELEHFSLQIGVD